MRKKAYLSPESVVTTVKTPNLMFTVSGEVNSDETPDEGSGSNRSRRRRHRDVWDDEEEEW